MNAIELNGLTKEYKDFTLGPVDLILPTGCIVGLIGENGAGKSTLIKAILGIVKVNSGSISVLSCAGKEMLKELKQDIGIVLDEVGFPNNITAKEINNILKGAYTNWNETQYFEMLKKFNLPLDKAFKDMSKGMKMKIGIATALCHDPKLLILDEAMSGLDPVMRDTVVDMLLDFTKDENHSILISSHIVSDLEKLCDYIVFLHDGKVTICEEKDLLKEQYGIIRCSLNELEELDTKAIVGKRISPYGVEAIVKKDEISNSFEISPVGLEELFVFMAKGEEK